MLTNQLRIETLITVVSECTAVLSGFLGRMGEIFSRLALHSLPSTCLVYLIVVTQTTHVKGAHGDIFASSTQGRTPHLTGVIQRLILVKGVLRIMALLFNFPLL